MCPNTLLIALYFLLYELYELSTIFTFGHPEMSFKPWALGISVDIYI